MLRQRLMYERDASATAEKLEKVPPIRIVFAHAAFSKVETCRRSYDCADYFRERWSVAMAKRNKKSEYEPFRELLLRQKEELNARIEQRRGEIVMEQEPEDEVGIAMRNSSTGMAIANIERELRMLAEIDLSLRRIETGDYGTCTVCGEKIPVARLKAIPWTRSCVECAGGSISRNRNLTHPANLLPAS